MDNQDIIATLKAAGFKGDALRTAWAVLMRESGGNPNAYNPDRSTGDDSHGWFQINMLGQMGQDRDAKFRQYVKGYTGVESLKDPLVNARAAYYMTNKGTNWYHWDIDSSGYDGGSHAAAFRERYAQWPGDKGAGQVRSGVGGKGSSNDPGYTGDGSTPPVGQDTLSMAELVKQAGFTDEFLKSHPQVRQVFEDAIANDWPNSGPIGKAKFEAALAETKWWKNNSVYARDYLMASMKGGKDFTDQVDQAKSEVQAVAVKMGAVLDDKALDQFTKAYMMNGWKERPQFLAQALTGELDDFQTDHIDYSKGGPQAIAYKLQQIAKANGVTYDDGYYKGAAHSVLAGLSSEDDYIAEIRNHAASRMPLFGDRIKNGENARDIASPYIQRMADTLELDPNSIDLNDPWLTKALGKVGPDGKPTAMSLYDFERGLRSDERWQYTKQAHKEVNSLTSSVLQMFGFGG